MAVCTECEADIEVDEFDIDRDDLLSCPDCGANLRVTGLSPVVLGRADEAELLEEAADEDVDDDEWD